MHDEHNAIRMGLTYILIDEPTAWREKVNTISHKKKEGEIVLSVMSVSRQYIICERMHDEHNAIRMGLTYSLIHEPTAWREKVNMISHKKKEGEIVVIVRSV